MCCSLGDLVDAAADENFPNADLVDLLLSFLIYEHDGELDGLYTDEELAGAIEEVQRLILERMDSKNAEHEVNKLHLDKLVQIARAGNVFQNPFDAINYCGRLRNILNILEAPAIAVMFA